MLLLLFALISSADWLTTKGNKIVDQAGNEVRLTGVNWFGFETSWKVFHGLWGIGLHTAVQQISEHGFNIIRVPISAEVLNEWKSGTTQIPYSVNLDYNADIDKLNNLEIFDIFLADCKKYGIKVMVDVHGLIPDSYTSPLWIDSSHPLEYLVGGLEWLASHYKNDDTLIAIDIKNEPHGKCDSEHATWDDSTADNNWKHAAEVAGGRILGANPNLLVMVEGIECYNGVGGWWGGNFLGVHDYPVNFGAHKAQLVYSPHEYGPSVYEQSWFTSENGAFTYDSLYRDHWKAQWMFIWEEETAPLLIGEWGGFLKEPNTSWLKAMVKLISEHGLSHTFWCFNPNSADTGGLLMDDWKTWDEEKYALIKPTITGKQFNK